MAHPLTILTVTMVYLSLSQRMIIGHVWPLPKPYVPVNPLVLFGNN